MFGVVMITCSFNYAEEITKTLLKKRLVAAVNILPTIHSWYWWKSSLQSTQEALLFAKTAQSQFPEIAQTVREVHPYQVPSIVMLPIVASTDDYANWISQEVKAGLET